MKADAVKQGTNQFGARDDKRKGTVSSDAKKIFHDPEGRIATSSKAKPR